MAKVLQRSLERALIRIILDVQVLHKDPSNLLLTNFLQEPLHQEYLLSSHILKSTGEECFLWKRV
jgi:hypothetical protein